MKKLLFLPLFFICSMSTSQAQFSLGVDAGLNYNNNKFSVVVASQPDAFETKAHVGYYVGLRPTYALSPKTNIGLGIQYSIKGYETQSEIGTGKFRNYYIDLLPQVEFRPIDLLGFVGGFNIGYLGDTGIRINDKWEKDILTVDIFEKVDIGLLLGLKVYLQQFYLTAHYNHGLTNISAINYTDANGEDLDQSQYNRNLQIGLGYMFNL